MGEYWGAHVSWPSMHYGVARYFEPEKGEPPRFTEPDSDNNSTSIDVIRRQIMNQHPEEISALADQWQNAYNLLSSVKDQLFTQSDALVKEGWKSPDARDAFMQSGPGKTLAYLDEWMRAASNNVTALRGLVGVVNTSRTKMADLWEEYKRAIEKARNIDGGEQVKTYFQVWKSWDDARRDEAVNDLTHTQAQYDQKARVLAFETAGDYFETVGKVSSGYGPPFTPMNAVMNIPGHKPWRMPSGPPGAPNMTAPPTGIGPVPIIDPSQLKQHVQEPPNGSLTKPPTLGLNPIDVDTPTAPDLEVGLPPDQIGAPPGTGTVTPPGTGVVMPPGLGLVTPPGLGIGSPAPITGTNLTMPNTGGAMPPALPPGTGGMRNGVLKSGGGLNRPTFGTESPNAAIRSPSAPPPVPGQGAPTRKPTAGQGKDEHHPPASMSSEEGFGRPPSTTAPPVLNNQRPGQQRHDRPGQLVPGRDSQLGAPTSKAAAPPVLSSPAANNPVRPNPTRTSPGGRPRADQTRDNGRPGPTPDPSTDWTGTHEVRAGASAPVLDAPAPPVSGSAVSKLEEVPKGLRSTTAARGIQLARPDGAVAPELAARHTRPGGSAHDDTNQTGRTDGDQPVVTDEDAFTVATPGGGVLVNQHDDPNYRPEPPTAISGR